MPSFADECLGCHEAAHAVVCLYFGWRLGGLGIDIAGGRTILWPPRGARRKLAIVYLAGAVADCDRRYGADGYTLAELAQVECDDLEQARRLVGDDLPLALRRAAAIVRTPLIAQAIREVAVALLAGGALDGREVWRICRHVRTRAAVE